MKNIKFSKCLGIGLGAPFLVSVTSAATLSVDATLTNLYNDTTQDVFASGAVDASSFTRVFEGRTDGNNGRGQNIIADAGFTLTDYVMDSFVIRKSAAQDFTGTTAALTLYVFEGTPAQWDAGDGQGDGSQAQIFDNTGITTIYSETFALNTSFSDNDYVSFDLDTSITMAASMGVFIKYDSGTAATDRFEIGQRSNNEGGDGRSYQAPDTGHSTWPSPMEYYAVGTVVPEPGSTALLGLAGFALMLRRRR